MADSDLLLQIGVGGILAILILREVFAFVKSTFLPKKTENNVDEGWKKAAELLARLVGDVEEIKGKVATVYEWHNVRDTDGRFVWYMPSALEKAIDRLANSVETQTEISRQLVPLVVSACKGIERLEERKER